MSDHKSKPTNPEPERAKSESDWRKAVGEALKKKKSGAAWPEPQGRYGNKKTRQKA